MSWYYTTVENSECARTRHKNQFLRRLEISYWVKLCPQKMQKVQCLSQTDIVKYIST